MGNFAWVGERVLKPWSFPALCAPEVRSLPAKAMALKTPRELFQAWRIVSLMSKCATLQLQLDEARARQKPTSIWSMRKADLVEVARRELDMRPDQAAKLTVLELRELIRQQRGTKTAETEDPLARLPKGMTRMRRDELIQECELRNINLSVKPTRAEMMLAIRAQVARKPGAYETRSQTGSDWDMAEAAGSLL